jgi:hypothetical protein
LLRYIAALIFIFGCTSIAWMILGATVMERTHSSDDQLKGHVASTWGSPQEQAPPRANVVMKETVAVNTKENGNTIVRNEQVERTTALPLDSTRLTVNLKLGHRQKASSGTAPTRSTSPVTMIFATPPQCQAHSFSVCPSPLKKRCMTGSP